VLNGASHGALWVVAVLLAAPAAAQQGAIQGTVTDDRGDPIAGARVVVVHEPTGSERVIQTGERGRFSAGGLSPGEYYSVHVSALGYEPAERASIPARAGAATPVDFHLARMPYRIPPVRATQIAAGPLAAVPGSAHVIGRTEFELSRPVSVSEMLERVPGVQIPREDGFGLHVNIGVRGLDPRRSSRVLLLEDGVPIHLAPYGDPSAHYQPSPDVLDRVEVLTGSGQILHGPQTVGGVVHYVRPDPPAARRLSIAVSAGEQGLRSAALQLGEAWGPLASALTYSFRQGDGPRDGWHHRVHDLAGRIAFEPTAGHVLTLQASHYRDDSDWGEAGLTREEFETAPFANPSPNDVFVLRRYAAQIHHRTEIGGALRAGTRLYFQYAERASWRQANHSGDRWGSSGYASRFSCAPDAAGLSDCGSQGRPRTYRFFGLEPRLTHEAMLAGLGVRNDLGVRLHAERVRRRQYLGSAPDARHGELTRDNVIETGAYALFWQARLSVDEWTFSPGVRLEQVRSENSNRMARTRESDRYTQWVPGVGVAYNRIPNTTVFAGLHRGFAPPRPADILNPQPGQPLVQVDAETSRNLELGVRTRPRPALRIEATAFSIDFRNQIVEGGLVGAGQRFVNAGATVHRGLELAGSLDLADRFAPGSSYLEISHTLLARAEFATDRLSATDGETPIRGNRLPYAPRHMLGASVGHQGAEGWHIQLHVHRVSEQFTDDLNTAAGSEDGRRGPIPAVTLFDASAGYELRDRGVRVFVAARNLFDRIYITERRSGIMVGMPRMVRLGFQWTL
jgi:Fe(3+) dicitrate transport protein